MIKRRIVALVAIVSIVLIGCAGADTESINKTLESEPLTESVESEAIVEANIPFESIGNPEEAVAAKEVVRKTTVENVQEKEVIEETSETEAAEENLVIEVFTPPENTSTFEHDTARNMYIINGTLYGIETDGNYYHAGYMFWDIANTGMEMMIDYIDGKYQEKYWREDYVPELLEKAEKSTLLESFVNGGGRIKNYYILDAPEHYGTYYETDVPIVVEYSFEGEIYYTVLVMHLSYDEAADAYWVEDIMQFENLDTLYWENGVTPIFM